MPRNIEVKARIYEYDEVKSKVASIATEDPVEIIQDDTFFPCESGRLKLRSFSESSGELIFYRRANTHGPNESFYLCSPTTEPAVLRESLTMAYGQAGRVQKVRTLYMVGRTRVHLDKVKNLGEFIELEVVLTDKEKNEAGVVEANNLMEKLGIKESQLIQSAYVDLLNKSDA